MNSFYRLLRSCFIAAWLLGAPVCVAGQEAKKIVDQAVEPVIGWRESVGIVVGALTKDGPQVYAYGKVGGPRNEALNGDSVFEIGSIGKVFTGSLLAEMVAQGELRLTDSPGVFLPAGAPVPAYRNTPMTLLDLATHTAGLPRRPTNLKPKAESDPYADYTVPQMYRFLAEYQLASLPGTQYEYSNIGFGLLGHVLSLKAGVSYEDLVLQRICAPLGMSSTRLRLPPALRARLARGHNRRGEPVPAWRIPEALAGAGGFHSTVNDLLKFVAANLDLTPGPLQQAMRDAQLPRRKTGSEMMSSGLGWQIVRRHGLEIIGHNGVTGGYASYLGFIRQQRVGVVVLANFALDDDAAELGFRLLEQLSAAAEGSRSQRRD